MRFNDPTVYPDSDGVLINKFGIKDKETWLKAERLHTLKRIEELKKNPISGNLDYNNFKKIHAHIFQDMYAWAGKERNLVIEKENRYCYPQYILENATRIFGNLKKENYLKNVIDDKFATKATEYMADIYHLHPFREGNTRSLCEFMRQLSLNAGYSIDFTKVPHEDLRRALFDSVRGHNEKLEAVFKEMIKPIEINITKEFQDALKNAPEIKDLPKRPDSKTLFNAYAKEALAETGVWQSVKTNQVIIEKMLKQNISLERIKRALCHSPEKVSSRDMPNKPMEIKR